MRYPLRRQAGDECSDRLVDDANIVERDEALVPYRAAAKLGISLTGHVCAHRRQNRGPVGRASRGRARRCSSRRSARCAGWLRECSPAIRASDASSSLGRSMMCFARPAPCSDADQSSLCVYSEDLAQALEVSPRDTNRSPTKRSARDCFCMQRAEREASAGLPRRLGLDPVEEPSVQRFELGFEAHCFRESYLTPRSRSRASVATSTSRPPCWCGGTSPRRPAGGGRGSSRRPPPCAHSTGRTRTGVAPSG